MGRLPRPSAWDPGLQFQLRGPGPPFCAQTQCLQSCRFRSPCDGLSDLQEVLSVAQEIYLTSAGLSFPLCKMQGLDALVPQALVCPDLSVSLAASSLQ